MSANIYAKRVALFIGNANYEHENRLTNPINDAILLQNIFEYDLKFDEVRLVKDADIRTLNREIEKFNQLAQNSDVAVIYFSGHGQQNENRQNYLLATDAKIEQAGDLRLNAITSDDLVNATEGSKTRVVILDACRDRPNSGFKSATKGLGRSPINGQGLLIAYATEAGKVAQDGITGNSPYATALAHSIKKQNKSIFAIFDEVADEVRKTTNGQQSPTREGNLRIDIYFTPPNITVPNVSIDTEISDWNKIKDSHNPNDFQNFLNHYPFGLFSNPAKAILAQLNNSNTNITSPQNNTRNDQELMSKGIWRDVKTNLTWMRCSVGQRWNGETCKGTPDKYKWEDIFTYIDKLNKKGFAGYKDWRLPRIDELSTIRQCLIESNKEKKGIPTQDGKVKLLNSRCGGNENFSAKLNQQIFPNTGTYWYWSSSPNEMSYNYAWYLDFSSGFLNYGDVRNYTGFVRIVRGD